VALGMMLVLAIALIAVISFTSANERSAELSRAEQTALAAAEAGLNHAESVLANATNPDTAAALPSSCGASPTVPVEGGEACYWGTLDTSVTPHEWTVSATSTVPNPTGGSALTHTASARFQVTSGAAITGNEAWNYVFSNSPDCWTIQNDVVIAAPLYTVGDLCLKNEAGAVGPQVDVRGSVTVDDNATIGASPADAGDPELRTGEGCRYTTSPAPSHSTCGTGQRIYTSSYSTPPPELTKPPVDLAYWRLNAKPGPNQPCTTSSGPVPSFTETGSVDLMPTASYSCQVWDGASLVGELSWNDSTDVLTIAGVVFFDGELTLQNDQAATYAGRATIYGARKGIIKNNAQLCAVSGCATTGWDPSAQLLTIVIGAADVPAFELDNYARFQGAVYVVGGFRIQNNAWMHGPVIADDVESLNHGFPADWPDLTALNTGMPAHAGAGGVTYVPGSWRG
jgi:type II secretory pathway pseudopilin PulG